MAIFDRFRRRDEAEEPVAPREGFGAPASAEIAPTMPSEPVANGGLFGGLRSMFGRRNPDVVPGALDEGGAAGAYAVLDQPIGREAVRKAYQTLQKYKQGKANLEQRIIANERWYKMRHWELLRQKDAANEQVQPASGWLFNALANKHADAMDNYPAPNILPREQGDEYEAKMLSAVIPVILESCGFEQTYSDVWRYKLKTGTGVYGVFWDKEAQNGMGDIAVRKVDILSLFWEPGIMDIQRSRNVFCVELCDNDLLVDQYPQLAGKLGTSTVDLAQYVYDDTVDTSEKSAVIDWYYKKRDPQTGRVILHYCKFVNDEVLFATENDPELRFMGWYDHGRYPFVVDVMFTEEGSVAGFGYVDVGKDAQEYIDRGNQAIMKNMLANVRPRYFVSSSGSVNEQEYADQTKELVHVDGALGSDSVMPINGKGLDSIYVEVLNNKIEELKEVTGNRDVSNGGTTSGVTAASAIAAMQEAGSKLSRDNIKASYRAFRQIVFIVIELIRQFYDLPRRFRILGEQGVAEFVSFSNSGLAAQTDAAGNWRLPEFDIDVTVQKASPYAKLSQNELALQFYQLGFFNPQMMTQAVMCLDMMDFDKKEELKQKIIAAGQAFWSAQAMTGAPMGAPGIPAGGDASGAAESTERSRSEDVSIGGEGNESSGTKAARTRVADSTSPK